MASLHQVGLLGALVATSTLAHPQEAHIEFNFSDAKAAAQWTPLHDLAPLEHVAQGLRLHIIGQDPYMAGPVFNSPEGQRLVVRLKLYSETGGMGQLFFFREGGFPTEAQSVHFDVPKGQWVDRMIRLPALGGHYRFRLDPPGRRGDCFIKQLVVDPELAMGAPQWHVPKPLSLGPKPITLKSGGLELRHARTGFGKFEVWIDGQLMAEGDEHPAIVSSENRKVVWSQLTKSLVQRSRNGLIEEAWFGDRGGPTWRLTRTFESGKVSGTLVVQASLTSDATRTLHYAPLMTLFPGLGSFGAHHKQALFCGLEYLDKDETSSSEKDLVGDQAMRLVPDEIRVTIPLMAMCQNERYLGLSWKTQPKTAPVFDVPNRQMGGDCSLFGVDAPGSDGQIRGEGELIASVGTELQKGHPLVQQMTLVGGKAENCVEAVEHYVRLNWLPAVAKTAWPLDRYVDLATGGWLRSGIHQSDGRFRHAYWPGVTGFGPQAAPDAALFMRWLAEHGGGNQAEELSQAAALSIKQGSVEQRNTQGVSHVRPPVASLVFGGSLACAQAAEQAGQALLKRFNPDGTVTYHREPGKPDFAKTHFARDANGLTAQLVVQLLEAGLQSGNVQLLDEGILKVRALDRYLNTAPRGAQTWEVPLHTPDILASAHLVRAYTLAYRITGSRQFLTKARYWAWTGVPFVSLINPTQQKVGVYATTAVYGATNWESPNWMGLPVQWCGLVYSDALYDLAEDDASGPWRQLAEGITMSGMDQTFPKSEPDLQGLLPDSYLLRLQEGNPVAINPGTLEANAIRCYSSVPLYSFKVVTVPESDADVIFQRPLIVHAPGRISHATVTGDRLTFDVEPWTTGPYEVLLVGPRFQGSAQSNGASALAEHATRKLVVHLKGLAHVEVRLARR